VEEDDCADMVAVVVKCLETAARRVAAAEEDEAEDGPMRCNARASGDIGYAPECLSSVIRGIKEKCSKKNVIMPFLQLRAHGH
jgi:hypothetical protein